MITVRLLGGMGNQMFQYAFALVLRERGYQVQFDRSHIKYGNPHPCIREYSLDVFGSHHFGEPSERIYSEPSLLYNEENLRPPDPSTVCGYWQTEKYYQNIESKIRAALTVEVPLSAHGEQMKDRILHSNSVMVHVRRTDFLKYMDYHGMPTMEHYYTPALGYVRSLQGATEVFVFSDDRKWCYENFSSKFHIVEGASKYEDMALMSLCKHAVIANSTFSWWGAWLGDHRVGRTVVAPRDWFATKDADSTDIVPERWIRL